MHVEVSRIASEDNRRCHIVLKLRRYYDVKALFRLFKAHVLSYIERSTLAIFHCSPSILCILDNVQIHFLKVVQIFLKGVLLQFNLAPFISKHHIAMLGLIHKTQLGIAPTCLNNLFPRARSTLYHSNTNLSPVHDRQIVRHVIPYCPIIFRRSIFALVRVYNELLADVVSAKTVSVFQWRLTAMLKTSALGDVLNWHELFNIR